jgi:hypothetical protein
MRQFLRVVLLLVLLITAAAQRRGFAPMPMPRPTPPSVTPPIATPPGATFGAWRKPEGPSRSPSEQPSVVVMPYAAPYPVYVDSQQAPPAEGDDSQQYPAPSSYLGHASALAPFPTPGPPPAMPSPQPAPAAPTAGLAPCGSAPSPPPVVPMARPAPKDDPPSFYIALNDGWVYLARAYWVEDDTLHYLTGNGRHNQVSLALVNRDVSIRLNAKRADEFHLPPPE